MARHLTETDARESLTDHARRKGYELRAQYGPQIGWNELLILLEDRTYVRYPCTVAFDDGPLEPGECAYPMPLSERPEDGFTMVVHPTFAARLAWVPHVVLYQLVVVNYGDFAAGADGEAFGAAALGLDEEGYYRQLCTLSDSVRSLDAGEERSLPAYGAG